MATSPQKSKNKASGYILEMAVIVVGIMLSFWLDEWRKGLTEKDREIKFLQEIRSDLVVDSLAFHRNIKATKDVVRAYATLLDSADFLDRETAIQSLDVLISYLPLVLRDNSYVKLRSGQNLQLVHNDSLANAIIQHYNSLGTFIREWGDIDKKFILERMIPYFEREAPYSPMPSASLLYDANVLKALKDRDHFRNMVKTNIAFKNGNIFAYQLGLQSTKKLIAHIDAYVDEKE